MKSRKMSALIYGGGMIVAFIIATALSPTPAVPAQSAKNTQNVSGQSVQSAPAPTSNQASSSAPASASASATATPQVTQKTDQQKLEDSLRASIGNTGSTELSYKGLDVSTNPWFATTASGAIVETQLTTVTITVQTGTFWDKNSLLQDTGTQSSEIFQKVFTSILNPTVVFIEYDGTTTDTYGNEANSKILLYTMNESTFGKIVWKNFDQTNLCNFLQQENQINTSDFAVGCDVFVRAQ